ncbi:MAG TPA: hypothetical protein VF530_10805 [Planctomycetota bacterium]
MLALLLLLGQAAPVAEPSREARVLGLLARAHMLGADYYPSARFAACASRFGGVPRVESADRSARCGNSNNGTLDAPVARRAALELCKIYGLTMEREYRLVEGPNSVVLDGLDPAARIGIDLEGEGSRGTLAEPLPEADVSALSAEEHEWLTARGLRVHSDETTRHRRYDQDEFTPLLTYLAGVVRFLNEVTEGEDVDLGGLLFERDATWDWFAGSLAERTGSIRLHDYGFECLEAGTVRLACRGLLDLGPPPEPGFLGPILRDRGYADPLPMTGSGGRPTALVLQMHAWREEATGTSTPEVSIVLRQRIDGVERTHASRSFALFLPGNFDLAQPFELDLELTPGHYRFYFPARIGAAAGEER